MKIELAKSLNAVKKFYFLEYFYVLLKSVEKYSDREQIFNSFRELKKERRLGESKYKKLVSEKEKLTKVQLDRYRYTFGEVIYEASQYKLINIKKSFLYLTELGKDLIDIYEKEGQVAFNQVLFGLMEARYDNAFRYIIDLLYKINKRRSGLLILPIYSPRQLDFDRSTVRTAGDIVEYSKILLKKMEEDLNTYLGIKKSLIVINNTILKRLYENELISRNPKTEFTPNKYNVITKRFRDYWFSYFLIEIYGYQGSLSSFDIWTYRGKQIGIIHATEFYPNFNGRVVYPTSVIMNKVKSNDFKSLIIYPNSNDLSLYIHDPKINDKNQQLFVDCLVNAYYDIRKNVRSYFVNLLAIREIVCYKMKISELVFQKFLDNTYELNLKNKLQIRISLEVDKLPEETKAMYLKQEPVMVDGKYRNIIAIDLSKRGKQNE